MGGSSKVNQQTGLFEWRNNETVQAVAYDLLITGYNTFNTNTLRLWRSKPVFNDDSSNDEADDVSQDG
jgi:hypothetical protein